jgi:DICT domain-containing protein
MTPGPSSSLREFVDEVASARRTVTVFAPDRIESLESYFETRNVAVEHEPLPDDGSGGFVVVTAEGEFVGSVGARAVRELVAPADRSLEFGSRRAIRVPLNLLADTTFVSFDRRQMLGASREFEDRAYRQERGTLRAGFQSLSKLKAQQAGYESLLKRTRLDVHVYGEPDWSPELPGATVHAKDDPEIGSFWFVVFDGGDDPRQACALLAEEVPDDPGSFRGFWTYDSETVAALGDYLRATYE